MSENHREPEVPEAEVPAVERLDGFARITLEELAITHSVKDGILQNACSTRPRVVVGLGKSAFLTPSGRRTADRKGLKRMMTKLARKRTCHRPMSRSTRETWLGRGVIRIWANFFI